ncbi:MAG TPA: tetratricopeptide repeat protein, partial [bacterium]|nr:tetratricopeptide repeat protein [bacterium]
LPLLEQGTSLMRRAKAARTEENVRALTSLGTTYLRLGRIDSARRTYRRVQGLAIRLGLDALNAKALSGLGLVEWLRRRFDVAADYLVDARDAFERVEDLPEMSRVLTNLGIVRREQGRYQEALRILDQAIRIKERLNDGGGRSAALDETAQVLLAMGRTTEAARAARRAIREAQAAGDRMREGEAQVTLGRVLRARGLDRDGVAMLRGALENFRRLGMPGRVAALSAEVSAALAGTGAEAEAARQVKLARHPSPHSKERSVEAAPLPLL